jgi:hypothetical protein
MDIMVSFFVINFITFVLTRFRDSLSLVCCAYEEPHSVRSEVPTAVSLSDYSIMECDIIQFDMYQHIAETCCLHHQSRRVKVETTDFSDTKWVFYLPSTQQCFGHVFICIITLLHVSVSWTIIRQIT